MHVETAILKPEERAVFQLRALYRQHGYLPYKMSRFEEYDLYVRNKDFLTSDKVITFADKTGKLLALKPDVTLSIIKNAPDLPGTVQKVYYNESVFRADAASHTLKEIQQAGLECVGDLGSYEIAEVLLLAAKSLRLLADAFVLDVSHMGLVGAVLDSCCMDPANRSTLLQCLQQKNAHELTVLSAGIKPEDAAKLQALVNADGSAKQVLQELDAVLTTAPERAALQELQQLVAILDQAGFAGAIRVDFSVGNDMKYYNGVVFKGYLEGLPASILSGGQYDKLLQKMGRHSRAIGFALYLSMLERQNQNGNLFDIDTLIIHDGSAAPGVLLNLAEEAAGEGSVLVATEVPANRNYRRIIRLRNGEVERCEHG